MYSYNEKDTVGKLVSNFWKISRVLRDTYDGRGSQRRVLTVLLKSGDVITQSALTERLDIQPGSASEVLAKLEAAGLIQRTANDKDRRTINISLTENGRVAAQEAYAKRDKVRHELMSNLNETEQEELLKLLEKLTADYSARYPKKSRANASHEADIRIHKTPLDLIFALHNVFNAGSCGGSFAAHIHVIYCG